MSRQIVWLALACVLGVRMAAGQQSTASVSGVVADESGAMIPHAMVNATSEATGTLRETESNGDGFYSFPQLAPGHYRLTWKHEGFNTLEKSGIGLTVGDSLRLDVTLPLGGVRSTAAVSASASSVDLENAALSSTMGERPMRELPLNGRDVIQLSLLEPGVAPSRRTADSSGSGTQLTIGGRRPNQISFRLDGTDINDANNNTPGSASGTLLGVDTLQEFRVYTNGYGAEFGRSAGGVVSAVTRAGGNQFHGALFEFLRNSALDAKNYFDSKTQAIPPFKRNQFGGVLSGPLVRDHTFFLLSYEGVRQRLGITNTAIVPTQAARSGILPGQSAIAVTPQIARYINLFPLPNGRIFSDGTGQFISQSSNATDEDFVAVRIDHNFSERTSLFGRYWNDGAAVNVPDSLRLTSSANKSRNQYATIQLSRTISDRAVNSARIAFNRSRAAQGINYLANIPADLSFLPGEPLGQLSATGLTALGPSRFYPSFSVQNLFEGADDFSLVAGRHALKLGVDQIAILFPTSRPQSLYGFYQFNSLADLLRGNAFSVELALPGSKAVRNWRQGLTAAYVTDTWRATSRLTVDAGLRYEYVTVPSERDNLVANLVDPLRDAAVTPGVLYKNPSGLNLAPRLGVAWDPFGDGRTSVRSAFGIYFDPLWTDFYANAANRTPPYYTVGSVRNPVFPDAQAVAGSPNFVLGRLDAVTYRPASPYSMQYNFSLQRELTRAVTVTLAYSGVRGVHNVRAIDQNQAIPQILPNGRKFFPIDSVVRNPNFTGIRFKTTDGQSIYNAVQAVVAWRPRETIQFRAAYTYSKAIDDGSIVTTQGGDNDLPQDPDSRKAERGLSNFDLRHYFVSYVSAALPYMPGPRWLTNGWEFDAISILASGNPFSATVGYDRARARPQAGTAPERPDLRFGFSNNPVFGSPSRYFDSSAFALPTAGFFGNLGRNTLIGPGLISFDTAVHRNFQLKEQITLQVRAEMFNSLNHPNFAIPSQRTVFSSTGPVASAGLITSTLTSARQLQFGLRLNF